MYSFIKSAPDNRYVASLYVETVSIGSDSVTEIIQLM